MRATVVGGGQCGEAGRAGGGGCGWSVLEPMYSTLSACQKESGRAKDWERTEQVCV